MKRFLPNALVLTGLALIMAVPIIDRQSASKPAPVRADTVSTTAAPKPPSPTTVATRASTPTTVAPGLPTEVTTPLGLCPQEDSCRIDYRHGQWHIYPAAH